MGFKDFRVACQSQEANTWNPNKTNPKGIGRLT
jgi:hypothetical protein